MMSKILASLVLLCAVMSPFTLAQATGDPIDLYFNDWHSSTPRTTMGSLEERDIFTRGDPQNPPKKGAVLRFINSYDYATLAPHASTKTTRLEGQQQIYFVASGQGSATAAGQQTVDLYRNIAVLMPANLAFTLKNTGDEPLAMYVINEPTPPGFRPNSAMLVQDENKLPITSSNELIPLIAFFVPLEGRVLDGGGVWAPATQNDATTSAPTVKRGSVFRCMMQSPLPPSLLSYFLASWGW